MIDRAILFAWCVNAAASNVLVPQLVDKGRDVQQLCAQLAGMVEAEPLPDEDELTSLSIMLALGAVEGALNQRAIGDCKIPFPVPTDDAGAPIEAEKKKWHACTWDRIPQSFSPWQISLPGISRTREGWTAKELLDDITKSSHVAYRMVRQSFVLGANEPRADRLAWYATGDAKSAPGKEKSRYRMLIAGRLVMAVAP